MQDAQRGGGAGGSRPARNDGGGGTWQAGGTPPAPPDGPVQFVDRPGAGDTRSDGQFVVRVSLAEASEAVALSVVEELRTEVDVLGTSLSTDAGPEPPDVFDVLVAMDYDPATVARALVEPDEIDGISVCRAETVGDDADDATGSDEDGDEKADDGGASTEGARSPSGANGRDADPVDAGGSTAGGTSVAPARGPEGAPADGTGDPASADGEAPEGTFDDLKRTTDRVSYDELVAELEETSMPGEFQDDVDLRPLIEGDGPASDSGGDEGRPATRGPAVATGDGGQELRAGEHARPLDPDLVVDALVTALEEDALDDDQRRAIADAFDPGPPKTLLVRLDHLQREVDELAAYKDALEGFIDEYGAGEGLVQQVRAVLEQFTEDVAELEAAIAAVDDRVDDLADVRSAVRDVDDRLGTHQARLDEIETLGERVDGIEKRLQGVGTLEERVGDLEAVDERVGEVDESVEGLAERLASVEDDVATVADDLAAVDESGDAGLDEAAAERLATLEERVPELDARVSVVESETAGTVEDVADDVAAIERRLDALESWQDRISSVLAAAVSDDD